MEAVMTAERHGFAWDDNEEHILYRDFYNFCEREAKKLQRTPYAIQCRIARQLDNVPASAVTFVLGKIEKMIQEISKPEVKVTAKSRILDAVVERQAEINNIKCEIAKLTKKLDTLKLEQALYDL
jgi:hypothetical protein